MNQRLLRPRASGFDPRSISGLALWLDAADTQSLYTTDAGPVTAVSAPTDISGCVGWWDASDAASITQSSGLVSQWNDKSGGNRHATASSTARPTTGTRTVGGRNALDFNGSSTVMSVSGSLPTAATHTVFAVFQLDATPAGTGPAIYSTQAATDQELRFVGSGSSAIQYMFNNNLGAALQTTPVGVSPVVVSVREATPIARSAGAGINASVTGSASAWAATGLVIGGRLASRFFDGVICELVIYDSTLSDAATASVEAYLAAKWGISGVHRAVPDELTAVSAPTEINGCVGWWDASDAATLFEANTGSTLATTTVGRWGNKVSGGPSASQATLASRPTVVSNALNGKGVLRFGGSQSLLGDLSPAITTNEYTVFVVCKTSGIVTNGRLFSIAPAATQDFSAGAMIPCCINSSNPDQLSAFNGSTGTNVGVVSGFSSYAIFSGACGSSSVTNAANGLRATAASVTFSSAAARFGIGGPAQGGTGSVNGDIAEVIYFSTALSTTDRARVEKYLAQKWGIANVPDPTPPVGYWRDKSGNGRHMLQPTGSLRPVVGSQGSRKAISLNGTTQWMRQERTNYQRRGMFVAWRRTGTPVNFSAPIGANSLTVSAATLGGSGYSSTDAASLAYYGVPQSHHFSANGANNKATAVRYNAAAMVTADANNFNVGFRAAPDTTAVNLFYAETASSAAANWAHFAGVEPYDAARTYPCQLLEVLFYNNTLTASQTARIERYLAAKWGIALAPQVSNADAQDWVNRVYANGGTVSSTTASAVNTFCNDIDEAGIRSLFYRANLFCGNADASLIAVRTPLYRGQSLGGTQFGNALDTNVNFAITDYAETGAGTGGLKGDGSTKYLDTGFATNMLPAVTSRHVSAYEIAKSPNTNDASIGGSIGSSSDGMILSTGNPASAYFLYRAGPNTFVQASSSYSGGAHWIGQNNAIRAGQIYKNGTLDASATAPGDCVNSAATIGVFSWKYTDATTSWIFTSAVRLGGYSIGLSMTDPQAAAYYAAMQTFQTAMSRNA